MCVIQGGALEWLLEQHIFSQNEILQMLVVAAVVVTAVICFGERRVYGNHIYPAELKKEKGISGCMHTGIAGIS